jgi:hypothetical protein
MYNATGQLVNTYQITDYSTKIKVDVAAGVYMIKVNTVSGKEFVEKIIIQK